MGPGEVFTVRNVGNLVPPCTEDGLSVGDVSEASAIEYAVNVLEIPQLVVMGHSQCGAMKAAHEGREKVKASNPNLFSWLSHAEAAHKLLPQMKFDEKLSGVDRLSQANVVTQLDHLKTYHMVRVGLAQGKISLLGAWFDIETARVHLFDPRKRVFAPVAEHKRYPKRSLWSRRNPVPQF